MDIKDLNRNDYEYDVILSWNGNNFYRRFYYHRRPSRDMIFESLKDEHYVRDRDYDTFKITYIEVHKIRGGRDWELEKRLLDVKEEKKVSASSDKGGNNANGGNNCNGGGGNVTFWDFMTTMMMLKANRNK